MNRKLYLEVRDVVKMQRLLGKNWTQVKAFLYETFPNNGQPNLNSIASDCAAIEGKILDRLESHALEKMILDKIGLGIKNPRDIRDSIISDGFLCQIWKVDVVKQKIKKGKIKEQPKEKRELDIFLNESGKTYGLFDIKNDGWLFGYFPLIQIQTFGDGEHECGYVVEEINGRLLVTKEGSLEDIKKYLIDKFQYQPISGGNNEPR